LVEPVLEVAAEGWNHAPAVLATCRPGPRRVIGIRGAQGVASSFAAAPPINKGNVMLRLEASGIGVVALVAFLAAGLPAGAETVRLAATLSAANEVPPGNSGAMGEADVSYDTVTHILSWSITHMGLTSPATAAHFHGPAGLGDNAPPIITITNLTSPVTGTATLTDGQAEQLLAEQWYLNFHTPAAPGGEIRGQVIQAAQ
jgi:hypothetical protein